MRHKCLEKACIAPGHLETGTHQQNALDRLRDGTQRNVKLTREIADAIRATKGEGTQQDRAVRFNVSQKTISDIDLYKIYTDKPQAKRPRIDRDPTEDECDRLIDKLHERTDKVPVSPTNPAFVIDPMHWLWKVDNQPNADYPAIYWRYMKRTTGAHRAALSATLQRRLDPKELGRHLCGNTRCCNPKHLATGTGVENAADKLLHGTQTSGENHHSAKLEQTDVNFIRWFFYAAGETITSIAASYPQVGYHTVSDVIHGHTWNPTGAVFDSTHRFLSAADFLALGTPNRRLVLKIFAKRTALSQSGDAKNGK